MLSEDVGVQVREHFSNAQHSAAGHRKLIHSLRQLHQQTAEQLGTLGEEEFFLAMVHCLNVLLAVRRSEEAVNRSLRFLLGFIVCSAEKDDAGVLGGPSATGRLIEHLMMYALEGIDSRDRLVRARLAQLMVACVNAVDELSDAVWQVFRQKMTERLFDKEAAVRVQAVHAMARLQQLQLSEDAPLLVLDVFLELLAHDPSAEVRKTVLRHIDVTERTLETILDRRRDVDAGVRKMFYAIKMGGSTAEIDVRMLTIKQRDAVLCSGLRDRDPVVRRSCIEMVFGTWIQTANNNLIQLLLSLDVIRHPSVAESALRSFYEMVPDIFTQGFPEEYLNHLTPETAIALRVYCERAAGAEKVVELVAELSELAQHIRRIYEQGILGGDPDDEELWAETEFVLVELFQVASLMDTADEMGRRVMQTVLVEMMANLELAEQTFSKALLLLSKLAPDFEDFLSITGQLMADLHELYSAAAAGVENGDGGLDEQLQRSLESLCLNGSSLSEDVRIMAQLRCLEIISAAFTLPTVTNFTQYSALLDLLTDAVVPAVNSPFAAIQARGLFCLGLACTLSLDLAQEYSGLFIDFYKAGQDEARLTALRIVFDLVMVHRDDPVMMGTLSQLQTALYDSDPQIQALAAQGYAKLLLHHRIVAEPILLTGLLQLYYHPTTRDNTHLRQAMSYFFQAYAYSSAEHQLALAESLVPLLRSFSSLSVSGKDKAEDSDGDRDDDNEDDEDDGDEPRDNHLALSSNETSIMTLAANQLVELTDPAKLIPEAPSFDSLHHAHALLAEELAWYALSHPTPLRLPLQLLSRLRLDSKWPVRSIKRLLFVMGQVMRHVDGGRVMTTALKRMVATLVELDDPTQVLSSEDMIELRDKLSQIQPLQRSAKVAAPKNARPTKSSALATTNVMDEISDLLD